MTEEKSDIQKALEESVELFNKQKKLLNPKKEDEVVITGMLFRCKSCRNNFRSPVRVNMCPTCEEIEQSRYSELREFLYLNPGTSMEKLCQKFNISREIIRKYLKDYKLEITGEANSFFLTCERCKVPINTGRYCEKCENIVSKSGFSQYESSLDSKFRTQK